VANDEHLAILSRGIVIWNGWRRDNPETRPDLRDANLRGTDLREADLSCANLSRAILVSASLISASLREADLHDADLRDAHLGAPTLGRGVTVRGVDLRGADLIRANLVGANLRRANLSQANLSQADLSEADLTEADLSGADLTWAELYGANLSQAKLSETNLSDAILANTILGDIDLNETVGLSDCHHGAPSNVDFRTLSRSGILPVPFLRGCGLSDNLIDYLPSLLEEAIRFYSCFISYSARDQLFADRLHADLQNKGVRCWFAPHDLPIGAKTWDAIDEAIRLRDKLLIILSEASIASDWVEDEVSKAFAEERERKRTILFPIRIDDTVKTASEAWARKLRDQRNIGDFLQWREPAEYQKSLDRLLRDLRASGAK
jgi:uncharacterized protein YjbI with pentapeptide repeats